jgi:hypothetical protein
MTRGRPQTKRRRRLRLSPRRLTRTTRLLHYSPTTSAGCSPTRATGCTRTGRRFCRRIWSASTKRNERSRGNRSNTYKRRGRPCPFDRKETRKYFGGRPGDESCPKNRLSQNQKLSISERREFLKDALEDSRETTLDNAEDKLGLAVKKGEAWAICFLLKTQGKSRGYVERIEQTGADGGAIQIENKAQDLSKLSNDELLQLKEIQKKLNAE